MFPSEVHWKRRFDGQPKSWLFFIRGESWYIPLLCSPENSFMNEEV